jgi:glycosyltransferase involved in cell wall biosynthesis
VLRSVIGQKEPPLVIAAFNIRGVISHFLRLARFGMQSVNHVVVFTPGEVERYQQMLSLAPTAISFCPHGWYDPLRWYDPAKTSPTASARFREKYVFSSGRSYRDYNTLARAVDNSNIQVRVSGRKFNLTGVHMPTNMQALDWLAKREFLDYMYHALFYVVPLQRIEHAGGDSSILQAMSFGKAVVATRAPSTETYIEDGVTGLLVDPENVDHMRNTLERLWESPEQARQMGQAARRRFEEQHTIENLAQRIHEVLEKVCYVSSK